MRPRPLVLTVLDGWGCRHSPEANAIKTAHTPFWDELWQQYPHTLLSASGLDVGLPVGQMGNSEVGHLTIGAGRVLYQDLTRINDAIANQSFVKNPALLQALLEAKSSGNRLHILGLLSPGGIHSHEDHIFAVLELATALKLPAVSVHAFLDGRDTAPKSALSSLQRLETYCEAGGHCIATVSGRFYAMDRDQRWERIEQAYSALTQGQGHYAVSAEAALSAAYQRGESDEFVSPSCIKNEQQDLMPIQDGDIVLFMNFRSDRARQISHALTDLDFPYFERRAVPRLNGFFTLTQYEPNLPATVLFPPISLHNILGECLETHGLQQLRLAETEKYAHVTFFFNGGQNTAFQGEERLLVPSPKVNTYDEKPEMSAFELTQQLIQAIESQRFDVIICNYANADMVGHTGNFKATCQAIETLDQCLAQWVPIVLQQGGEVLITADHGNAECMFDEESQQPHTAHTTELVPLIYLGRKAVFKKERAALSDVAPTVLELLGLPLPPEMSGEALIQFS
jgi:2,3-bisphosphoglycerate-independent phosphoglycerate mutase